jgi:hypothetical protein
MTSLDHRMRYLSQPYMPKFIWTSFKRGAKESYVIAKFEGTKKLLHDVVMCCLDIRREDKKVQLLWWRRRDEDKLERARVKIRNKSWMP